MKKSLLTWLPLAGGCREGSYGDFVPWQKQKDGSQREGGIKSKGETRLRDNSECFLSLEYASSHMLRLASIDGDKVIERTSLCAHASIYLNYIFEGGYIFIYKIVHPCERN